MAVASTDYLQEVDAASTPKMAPTTPMQVLQKPQQPRESINEFPSLTLGGHSEVKGSPNKSMPARLGLASRSTPSKLQGRTWLDNQKGPHQDENSGPFYLSKYEKKYQRLGTASHMYQNTGPLSLHTVDAHAGHSNMTPHRHVAQGLSPGLEKLQEESPTHTQVPAEKKGLGTPTSATGDAGASDPAILFSQTPGEVALDAYELYSKMFPSTCTATAEYSTDLDVGQYRCCSPFLDHMNNMQLLRSVSYSHKPLVRARCERNDDLLECEKKIKFAKVKEEDTPGDSPTRGDTKPFRMPPESMSTVLCAPNSGKVVHSGGCAGHASVEVTRTSTQPAVGLKLYTSTACMQMPKALPIVTTREPSIPLSSEPSALRATSKTPVQGGSSPDADWGRYLALSATPARSGAELAIMRPFQERFKELQAFLKQCDEGDQNESIQALRTLSGAARSGYAVELETRAIRLSLEEGKEMKRMRLLNVLGRISEGNLDTAGATPHGPRLPAPGAASTPKHVL